MRSRGRQQLRQRAGVDSRVRFAESVSFIRSFLGSVDYFPENVYRIVTARENLRFRDRISICVFLRCNGVPAVHIMNALLPRLRDHAARVHVQRLCEDIDSGSHPDSWYYYDMRDQVEVYVKSRKRCDEKVDRASGTFHAGMYEWGEKVKRVLKLEHRYPTLREQRQFFAEWFGPTSSLALM